MSRLERIVAACGGELMDGGRRALIPGPEHSPADRSVSLLETNDGRVLIYCFSPKDDWRAVHRALALRGLLDEEPDQRRAGDAWSEAHASSAKNEERVARARRLWTESRPMPHTPAAAYLTTRAIAESLQCSQALRFHPRMTSLDDRRRRPALIAAITAADGALQGVQATLLASHGEAKANVETPRRVIGRLLRGVVRLADAADVLAIGEGVETMLSASLVLGLPAWAALTAYNLAHFTPPANISRLVIAADNDAAGLAAAESLRQRSGIPATIQLAPDGAADWNEWARLNGCRAS